MKIGLSTFGGDGGKSGISQYIINLIKQFAQTETDNTFEVIQYKSEQQIFEAKARHIKPLYFSDRWKNPVVNVGWHQSVLPVLSKMRKFDLLFLPAGNRRLPVVNSCPTVGTVHDFSSLHVEGKYDPARMFYIKKVLPWLVRKLNYVITDSESSKDDIVNFAGVPDENVSVIPLAANPEKFFPNEQTETFSKIRVKYGIRDKYIVYVSRLEHPGKNHVRLIKAFEQIKLREQIPHQLVIAGSDWDRSKEIYQAAESTKCVEDIIFTGFLPNADLPILYNAADLMVFPSLYEGFGLPILEAMACGTPVACSNLSSLPEVAGDAGVLFDPYEVDSIAEAVSGLLTNEDRLREYSKKGIEQNARFSWEKTARQTLEVLDCVGHGKPVDQSDISVRPAGVACEEGVKAPSFTRQRDILST